MPYFPIESFSGLTVEAFVSSILYCLLGLILMLVAISICNATFKLNLRKEILEDQNTSAGIVIAGLSIAVAIIVSAAIK